MTRIGIDQEALRKTNGRNTREHRGQDDGLQAKSNPRHRIDPPPKEPLFAGTVHSIRRVGLEESSRRRKMVLGLGTWAWDASCARLRDCGEIGTWDLPSDSD